MKKFSDTELLNFLEKKNKEATYTGRCIFRMSGTGRGWRLHETDFVGAKKTVRSAIVDAIEKEKK